MANSSNALGNGFPARRRTILLLVAGGLAGLFPRSGRSGVEPQQAPTAPTMATGLPGFPDLRGLGPAHQVRAISFGDQGFRVSTGDGRATDFRETHLRFKIDSSGAGPLPGAPVIMRAGSMGDRAWIFFASPDEISTFIKHAS